MNYSEIRKVFRQEVDGKNVDLFLLENDHGVQLTVTNFGGRMVHLMVPDKEGTLRDVILGYDSLNEYMSSTEVYYGALIGRFGNRIAGGKFAIDGHTYHLENNNVPNNLHGGTAGFHNVVWEVKSANSRSITMTYFSPDREEGFPGNLRITMTYSLSNNNEIVMDYRAVTDQQTPVNLTNHAFFNLNGDGNGDINGHHLQINASAFTPVDVHMIPTGEMFPVEGTPFDFRLPRIIGSRLKRPDDQLKFGNGYDHNFVLDKGVSLCPELVAIAESGESGIILQVLTTEPGIQFYGGNFLTGNDVGKNGVYQFQGAFCLETQHFPDSPNQPDFPTTILRPGDTYQSQTIYQLQVK